MTTIRIQDIVYITGDVLEVGPGLRQLLPKLGQYFNAWGAAALFDRSEDQIPGNTGGLKWQPSGDGADADEILRFLTQAPIESLGIDKSRIQPFLADGTGMHQPPILFLPLSYQDSTLCWLAFLVGPSAPPDELMENACLVSGILYLWLKACDAEKRLKDLVAFIPNPLMMLDKEETITVWNPAMEKMSGVRAENMIGKGHYEHALPFYNERRPTSSNLILKPDRHWESKYIEMKRDGDVIHALARTDVLPNGPMRIASKTRRNYDLKGNIRGSVHMIQDVTHEHELEKSLSRTRKMYQDISEFAGVGIALLDLENIISVNDTFSALLELVQPGKTAAIFERMEPGSSHGLESAFNHVLNTGGEPASLEFIAFLPVKGRREFQAYVQGVNVDSRQVLHFVVIDITESKQMERRKNLYQMRMYHSDRLTALGTLSAGIAHELNQPLNTIRVIADGILYGRDQGWRLDEDEVYENAGIISRQTTKMSEVIQNVRNFARDDTERDDEQVDLNQSIRNVFAMIGQQLSAHLIRVDCNLEEALPLIRTQQNRFEQVVMNLVVNAQQALDSIGKKEKRLWVKTGYRFGQVFLEVGDNAYGISKKHKKQIFDPFFTTKDVGQGTGLGLAISQTIVLDLGGEINAYNNTKGGATFFMTLPVKENR